MDNNTKHILLRSVSEIKSLRKDNQLMAARLDMFDKMMLLFHTPPNYQSQGMTEDVCYQIEKLIESESK